MLDDKDKIELISKMNLSLNQIKDLDLLLEKTLLSARQILNADAGSIYLCQDDQLKFSYTQNDTLQKRLQPGKKLLYSTFSMPIDNQSIAGYVAKNSKILNIPDVYVIDETKPYSFNSNFDKSSEYKTISMLTVPMINQAKKVLGVMQIINPKNKNGDIIAFTAADENIIQSFASGATLAIERAQMTRDIILRTINVAQLRDPKETGAHVSRVAAYSVEIFEQWARKHGVSKEEVDHTKDLLRMAAMLHDVGKVAISDIILKKPGKLDKDEFATMQKHTSLGAHLFKDSSSELDDMSQEIALNHHEKWDGTGYPGCVDTNNSGKNLIPKKGEEIPILARIVAVADVFDALNSRRAYKEPWTEEQVLQEIRNSSGKNFDPEVVDAFFESIDVLRLIMQRYPDSE